MNITSIHIENYSLIEDLIIDLVPHSEAAPALNVFEGESGSGKSLIFKALRSIFGDNQGDAVRDGAEKAIIELTLEFYNQEIEQLAQILGDENLTTETEVFEATLQKVINKGRHKISLNGEIITVKKAREIYAAFINSSSQGDQFQLYDRAYQLRLVDAYGNIWSKQPYFKYINQYRKYHEAILEYNSLVNFYEQEKDKKDFHQFALTELMEVGLQADEDTQLEQKIAQQKNSGKITAQYDKIHIATSSVQSSIATLLNGVKSLVTLGISLPVEEALLESVGNYCSNLDQEIASRLSKDEETTLEALYARSSKLATLCRKYRQATVNDLIKYQTEMQKSIDTFSNFDVKLASLKQEVDASKAELLVLGKALSDIRKTTYLSLIDKIRDVLSDLNFMYSEFKIIHEINEEEPYSNGLDSLEFLVTFNAGIAPQPLHKVISGGEASRLSLAILSIVHLDNRLILLDEIDSGLDPKSLDKVATKLVKIAKTSQVLCISHNQQIISKANKNILIRKEVRNGKTYTEVATSHSGN